MNLQQFLNPWIVFGFFGQFVFFLRFIVQWIASEKNKAVTIPMGFWYLSVLGTIIILIYSIHIKDIVFSTAQVLSFFIYGRNIHLQLSQKSKSREAESLELQSA